MLNQVRGFYKRVSHTLKFKLMTFLVVLVIPLIVILYLNNLYSIKLAEQQMNDYTVRILDTYVESLNTKMENVSEYLLRMCLDDAANLNVDNRNDRYFYRLELHTELQKVIGFYDVAEGIFVYQGTYDEFARYTDSSLSYSKAEQISRYIRTNLSDILAKDAKTWNIVSIDDEDYFIYTLKTEDTYLGAWVNIGNIMEQIRTLNIGKLVDVEFGDRQGKVLVRDEGFPEDADGGTRETYNVSAWLQAGGTDITVKLETVSMYRMLSSMQKVIIIVSIAMVLILISSGMIYQKYIFRPMKNVEKAIAQVEQGNWNYRIQDEKTSAEFERINENFNSMAKEIHNLKIDIYEEEIHRQQVELEYLHYQIKPHFILNVINTINSMAQIKETELIQKMTRYLSGYVRYTFRKEHSMVTIREELENVKNYLEMQLLRFPDSLECTVDMEARAMDAQIPAMTIMTFVENIIKHAFDMYTCTRIALKAVIDSDDQVHISIKDSGSGFSQEAIEHIMTCEEISEEGKRVGIVNIKKRLRLLYGDSARVIASNDSGAKIEIIVPVQNERPGS